jgi:hypothetical protein
MSNTTFRIGQTVLFNHKKWNAAHYGASAPPFTVRVTEVEDGTFHGTVTKSENWRRPVGSKCTYLAPAYFTALPLPPRDLRGRFAKLKPFVVHLREIRVVPVIIQAANEQDAEALVMQGDGDYQNAAAYHSDLNASEYFDNLTEKPTQPVQP